MVGDIHGMLDEFRRLVDGLRLELDDRLILVGDLMDKGPRPAECVRFAREIGAEMVLGNHEESHLRWRRHEDRRRAVGTPNPMRAWDEHRRFQNEALSADDIAWLSGLPSLLRVGNWLIVHGGLLPGLAIRDQRVDTMLRV